MQDTKEEVRQAHAASGRAQEKVATQRNRLATISVTDPTRPDQEKILDAMILNASIAKLNKALTFEDDET